MQNEVELTAAAPAEPVQPDIQPVEAAPEKVEQPVQPETQPAEGVAEAPVAAPSKEWTNVESFAEASFMSSVINIINTVIGAGILSIAFSIMRAGVFGSILLILVILIPSLLTSYYLSVATVYTGEPIYGDVGTKLCNKFVGISTNITQVLLDFGIDIAYMMVLFNQVVDIARELFGVELSEYKTVGTIQSTLLFFLFLLAKSISFIAVECSCFLPHPLPSHLHQDHGRSEVHFWSGRCLCGYFCLRLYCHGYQGIR